MIQLSSFIVTPNIAEASAISNHTPHYHYFPYSFPTRRRQAHADSDEHIVQSSIFCSKHARTKPGRESGRRAAGKHCLQPLVYEAARHGGVYISWSTRTTCLLISLSRLAGPRQVSTLPLVAINVNVELSAESTARLPHSSGRGRILLWLSLSLAFFSFYCKSLSQATTSTIVSSSPFS